MRQKQKKPKPPMNLGDASLYPLDPETAIRAILETGPHPKDEPATNRRRRITNRGKHKTTNGPDLVEGREPPKTDDPNR
jgi:hypothetical protein